MIRIFNFLICIILSSCYSDYRKFNILAAVEITSDKEFIDFEIKSVGFGYKDNTNIDKIISINSTKTLSSQIENIGIIELENKNIDHIDIKYTIDISVNNRSFIQVFDHLGQLIPHDTGLLSVKIPVDFDSFKPGIINTLKIQLSLDESLTLISSKNGIDSYFFNPAFTVSTSRNNIAVTLLPTGDIDSDAKGYKLLWNDKSFYIDDRLLDKKQKLNLANDSHLLTGIFKLEGQEVVVEAHDLIENAEDIAFSTGILFHFLEELYFIPKNNGVFHFDRKLPINNSLLFYKGNNIDNNTILSGQTAEISINQSGDIKNVDLLVNEWLVTIISIDKKEKTAQASIHNIDNIDVSTKLDDPVTLSFVNEESLPKEKDLIRASGLAFSHDKLFIVERFDTIDTQQQKIKLVFSDAKTQSIELDDKGFIRFSDSLAKSVIFKSQLINVSQPINTYLTALQLGADSQIQFVYHSKANSRMNHFTDRNSFKALLEDVWKKGGYLTAINAEGQLVENSILFVDTMRLSISLNDENTQSDATAHIDSKVGTFNYGLLAIPATVVAIGGLYGAAYYLARVKNTYVLSRFLESLFLPGTRDRKEPGYDQHIDRLKNNLTVTTQWTRHTSPKDIEYFSSGDNFINTSDTAVIYFGGNAEDVMLSLAITGGKILPETGNVPIFTMNYPGFGDSKGKKSFDNIKNASIEFAQYIKDKYNIKHIVPVGRSLGGAIAAQVASAHKSPLLYLQSTFTSAKEAAISVNKNILPPFISNITNGLISIAVNENTLNTKNILNDLDPNHTEVLISHGTDDKVIPFSHFKHFKQLNYSNLKAAEVPQGNHNDAEDDKLNAYFSKRLRAIESDSKSVVDLQNQNLKGDNINSTLPHRRPSIGR